MDPLHSHTLFQNHYTSSSPDEPVLFKFQPTQHRPQPNQQPHQMFKFPSYRQSHSNNDQHHHQVQHQSFQSSSGLLKENESRSRPNKSQNPASFHPISERSRNVSSPNQAHISLFPSLAKTKQHNSPQKAVESGRFSFPALHPKPPSIAVPAAVKKSAVLEPPGMVQDESRASRSNLHTAPEAPRSNLHTAPDDTMAVDLPLAQRTISSATQRSSVARETPVPPEFDTVEDVEYLTFFNMMNKKNRDQKELAIQATTIEDLKSQLASAQAEQKTLMQRLHDAKETARKAVSSSISSVQALEEDLKRLKARHDETTKVTLRDVQKELDDLTVFKDSIWDKMSDIDVMLDENGHFMKGIEAKALIQELRDEAERSHQANEYLRNRLLSVGTDLCHAQERVYDLEAQSIDESKARQVSTENLAVYASKLDQLTLRLEKRDRELLEAVQKSSGLQQQVEATQVRVKQLEQEIDKREGQLVEFRELQERSQELSDALAASEELVKSLTEELAQTKHDLEAASTKIDQQSETCTSLDRKVISLQEAYDMMTSQLSSQRAQAQEDLSKAALNLSAKEQDLLKAVQEVSALKVQERDLTKQLEDAQKSNDRLVKEAAKKEDEYTQLDKQLSILTERFQDQSISLRLVKDQHGNIQERLVSCEAAHAAELKSTQVSLQRDNDALRTELEHDKQVLREQLDVAQAERDSLTAQMDDHKRRQESQDTIHASLQTRVAVLEGERDLLRASAETLRLDSETLRRDSADALRRCTGDFEARLTAQEVVNAEALRRGVEDFEKRLRSQEISSAEALRRCAEDFEKRLSSQELSSTEALRRCTEDFEGREAAQAASYEARYAQQEATYTEHIKERVDACERINTAAIEAVEAKHNLNLTLIKRDLAAAHTELELHATRSKERDDSHSKSLAAETIKYELAQENATHLSRQLDDLQQRLSFLDNANAQLTREVEGSLPQGQEGAELSSLRSRIAALEAENELLRRKGSTLQSRYDAGTLEPHEQQFASSVMRGVRASHEAEMVKKSNEILRRDRQITALEADVASLTASLIGKLGQESKDGSLSEGVVNVSNEPTRVSVNDSTVRNTTISSMTAFSEVGTVAMEVKESTVQAVSLGGRFSQLGLEGSDSVMSEPPSSDDQPLADAYGSDSVDPRPTKRHRPHSPSAALEGLASTARRGRNTQSGKTRQTVVSRMKPDPQRAKDTESAAGVETEKATPKPLARKNAGKIRKRNG